MADLLHFSPVGSVILGLHIVLGVFCWMAGNLMFVNRIQFIGILGEMEIDMRLHHV